MEPGGITRAGRGARRRPRAGWTLLEITISTAILLTLVVGFSYGLVSSTSLDRATREQGTAREAARGQLEELRGTAFQEILARYDDDEEDDPAAGISPGRHSTSPGSTRARTTRPSTSHPRTSTARRAPRWSSTRTPGTRA